MSWRSTAWVKALVASDRLRVSVMGMPTGVELVSADGVTWASPDPITVGDAAYTASFAPNGGDDPRLTLTPVGSGGAARHERADGGISERGGAWLQFTLARRDYFPGQPVPPSVCDRVFAVRLDAVPARPAPDRAPTRSRRSIPPAEPRRRPPT